MTKIVWDKVGERVYESGVDRGVFYSPTQLVEVDETTSYPKGFAWNGLFAVDTAQENKTSAPIYFDGEKTFDMILPGDFSATIKAFTYPDEFMEFDGYLEYEPGIYVDGQDRGTFGLSYRTKIGNDVDQDLGYKIHIIYNCTAVADDLSTQTSDSNIQPINFSWKVTTVPVFTGRRPASHIILDSTKIDPDVLTQIEDTLYGTESTEPVLPTLTAILAYISVIIIDLGDGTWMALGPDSLVSMTDLITFEIDTAKAVYLDADTYYFLND